MSVVVVVPDWSARPRTGGLFVDQMLIGALARLTDVHVLAVCDSTGDSYPRHGATTVTVCPRRPVGVIERLFGRLPTIALWARGTDAGAQLRHVAAAHEATHVLVSSSYTAINVPPELGLPMVVVALNVEHRRLRALAGDGTAPARRAWLGVQARRAARLECDVFRRATAVLAISPQDLEPIRSLVRSETPVIPMPVVPEPGLESLSESGRPDASVLFVGSLGYRPNVEAARRLIEDVLPRLRRAHPHCRLLIAGSTPPAELAAASDTHGEVVILPDFDEPSAIFEQATIFVAPLPSQEGISIKTLNAFASGTPVVTTHAVLRSVGAQADVHALVAEGPDATAEAVGRLLGDASLRVRLATAARAFITEHFSEQRLLAALRSALAVA